MEKAFLDSKGVSYTNHFVDEDDKAREEMINLTKQMGVPVTVLDYSDGKTWFIGFQQALIEQALNGEKVGTPCG